VVFGNCQADHNTSTRNGFKAESLALKRTSSLATDLNYSFIWLLLFSAWPQGATNEYQG
jgi:hypothetical protein